MREYIQYAYVTFEHQSLGLGLGLGLACQGLGLGLGLELLSHESKPEDHLIHSMYKWGFLGWQIKRHYFRFDQIQ